MASKQPKSGSDLPVLPFRTGICATVCVLSHAGREDPGSAVSAAAERFLTVVVPGPAGLVARIAEYATKSSPVS